MDYFDAYAGELIKIASDSYMKEYAKHTALNLGQAGRDVTRFFDHPDADAAAKPGTRRHKLLSAKHRAGSLASNLFYAALPPRTHHTKHELKQLEDKSVAQWFKEGLQ